MYSLWRHLFGTPSVTLCIDGVDVRRVEDVPSDICTGLERGHMDRGALEARECLKFFLEKADGENTILLGLLVKAQPKYRYKRAEALSMYLDDLPKRTLEKGDLDLCEAFLTGVLQ